MQVFVDQNSDSMCDKEPFSRGQKLRIHEVK